MSSTELYSADAAKERFEELMHYGMPRRSGRYPWGSGEDPHQHGSRDFLGRVDELRKSGFTFTDENGKKWTGDTAIAKSMGLTTGQFRTELGIANSERRALKVATAKSLKADGLGDTEIGRKMGVNESTVRSWLNDRSEAKMNEAKEAAAFIKNEIDKRAKSDPQGKGMVDVGVGVEKELRISKERLNQALYMLEREGYAVYKGGIPQVQNPGQQTNQRVICTPGTKHKEIYEFDRVHALNEDNYISRDGGKTFEKKFHYPASLDPKRLKILLADEIGPDGEPGVAKDGIIQLRRNVPDLSLGESNYSQVRILVGKDKYLKGMAVYSDNMPDGVDVIFNSNKTSYEKALKDVKKDPDNPFGSAIKDAKQGGQYWYDPKTGKRVSANEPGAKLGLINKRADEGDWTEWADALPSQFLAKQSKALAKKQLGLAKADKLAEFDDICSIDNPTIKKHFLDKFASECDAAAVHLKAAALPGQKYHVIIPVNTLKDTEVYAPGYENGTKLALIRYPHGGTFEIPILTVNNKNANANKIIGKMSVDAVGINKKIADQLSGADFDGDTVMCIPTHDAKGKVKIENREPLKGLVGFDPQSKYATEVRKDADGTKHGFVNGREVRLMRDTQKQMGVISNLITDMTLAGASDDDLAAAVRHSMVVIDAEKHSLDFKQSELDNNIAALHKRYQGKATGGASTIISKAKGEYTVDKRQGTPKVNVKGSPDYDPKRPEGALLYKTADDVEYTYTKTYKNGTTVTKTGKRHQKSTKMAEVDDAMELVSPAKHAMELLYADYANSMKSLANKARLEKISTGKITYDKNAKKVYQKEVDSLMRKLNDAELNTAKERAAQRAANASVQAKAAAGQIDKKKDSKKVGTAELTKYREEYGSVSRRDRNIFITDREWEAIQAGAISETKLTRILNNADVDDLRQRATPRTTSSLSNAQIARIKAYSNSNYSINEIARMMGKSPATISKYMKGAN